MKMAKFSRSLKVSVLCVLWYFMSSTNNVICKKILRNYPYPMTITLFHLTSISLFMYPVLMIANLPTKFHYSKHFFWKFIIPLGFGKMLGSAASYVSIWRVSVSYAHTIKASLPIFTVILSTLLYREKQSNLVYISLLPIVFGVATATVTELSFEIYGMLSALLATMTWALQILYSKQALKEIRLNHLQMLMVMSQFGLFICIPIWVFVDTPVMAQDVNLQTTEERLAVIAKLSLSGFINFMQNVIAFSVLHLLSPLSYSVANATKRILVIIVSLVTLRNPVTPVNFFGMMLAVLGVFCYNRAKIIQNSRKKLLPTSTKDTEDDLLTENDYLDGATHRTFKRINSFI